MGLFASLLIAVCGGRCPAQEPRGEEILTEHYNLYVEGPGGPELGNLLEQLHVELKEFFRGAPHELLRVKVFANKERYARALVADNASNGVVEKAGGTYSRKNRTVYVASMDPPIGTRYTVLHEATHQFHKLVRTGNQLVRSAYYSEGLASHFELYRFNHDSKISFGTIPDIAFPDYPAFALSDCMDRPDRSLRDTATDTQHPPQTWNDYGRAWGLVSFLLSEHHTEYLTWSAALDNLAEPSAAWNKAFGGQSDEQLSREYLEWLKKHQMPWSTKAGAWQSTDERTFDGSVDHGCFGVAVLKRSITSLTVSVNTRDDTASAGVVIDYESPTDFRVVHVQRTGEVRIWVFVRDECVSDTPVPGARVRDPGKFAARIRNQNGLTKVFIDDVPILELNIRKGRKMGVEVSDGWVTFRDIKAE